MDRAPRAKKQPISLSLISSLVIQALKQDPAPLSTDCFDFVAAHLPQHDRRELPNARRRIYDVISVIGTLESFGIFVKRGRALPINVLTARERVRQKQLSLGKKWRSFRQYHALIARNRRRPKPAGAIALPFIIIAIRPQADGTISRTFDARTAVITSSAIPTYLGPGDLLERLFD
jgi:hypothetical protein